MTVLLLLFLKINQKFFKLQLPGWLFYFYFFLKINQKFLKQLICPDGGIGRRAGLKHLWETVPVRLRLRVQRSPFWRPFFVVRYAYHISIGCKSRTSLPMGIVSQEQGCLPWGRIWRKLEAKLWLNEQKHNIRLTLWVSGQQTAKPNSWT